MSRRVSKERKAGWLTAWWLWAILVVGILAPAPASASRTLALHDRPMDVLSDGHVLVYVRARYYDPKHGRWLQRDPTGYADGGNLYESFRGNAASYRDPYGLETGDEPGMFSLFLDSLVRFSKGRDPLTGESVLDKRIRRGGGETDRPCFARDSFVGYMRHSAASEVRR